MKVRTHEERETEVWTAEMLTDLMEYGVIEDWYREGDSWVVDSGDSYHVLTTDQAFRSARRTLDRMEG